MFKKPTSVCVEDLLSIETMIIKQTMVDDQRFNICIEYIPTSVTFKDYDVNIDIYNRLRLNTYNVYIKKPSFFSKMEQTYMMIIEPTLVHDISFLFLFTSNIYTYLCCVSLFIMSI